MTIKRVTLRDIISLEKPISFLANNSNCDIIRVICGSYTSCDKEMVADINLAADGIINIYSPEETHSIVSSFIDSNLGLQGYRMMRLTGVDRGIINQCIGLIRNHVDTLNGNDKTDYRYNLLLSHMESIRYEYLYFDARVIYTPAVIKQKIDQLYLVNFLDVSKCDRFNCYCGITNDIDRRMDEHRKEDFRIYQDKVFAIVCPNKDIAVNTEKLLSAEYRISKRNVQDNVDAAGRGAEDDTSIVYLLMPCKG